MSCSQNALESLEKGSNFVLENHSRISVRTLMCVQVFCFMAYISSLLATLESAAFCVKTA